MVEASKVSTDSPDIQDLSSDRVELTRRWLRSEASLEGIFRVLQRNSIGIRDALGPIREWIDVRLQGDAWIQTQLALITDAEARRFEVVLYDGIIAYWKRYQGIQGQNLVPHIHEKQKERARKAIQKLVAALKALNFDPDITALLEHERHEWARRRLERAVAETPHEAGLLARILQPEGPDQNAFEELRDLWRARKRVPTASELLESLDSKVALLNAAPLTKFSARSMFLREIWSGLGAHTLERKRLAFLAHVDDAVFPGHWTGETETRIRELRHLTSDLRRKEREFKKHFPDLQRLLKSSSTS